MGLFSKDGSELKSFDERVETINQIINEVEKTLKEAKQRDPSIKETDVMYHLIESIKSCLGLTQMLTESELKNLYGPNNDPSYNTAKQIYNKIMADGYDETVLHDLIEKLRKMRNKATNNNDTGILPKADGNSDKLTPEANLIPEGMNVADSVLSKRDCFGESVREAIQYQGVASSETDPKQDNRINLEIFHYMTPETGEKFLDEAAEYIFEHFFQKNENIYKEMHMIPFSEALRLNLMNYLYIQSGCDTFWTAKYQLLDRNNPSHNTILEKIYKKVSKLVSSNHSVNKTSNMEEVDEKLLNLAAWEGYNAALILLTKNDFNPGAGNVNEGRIRDERKAILMQAGEKRVFTVALRIANSEAEMKSKNNPYLKTAKTEQQSRDLRGKIWELIQSDLRSNSSAETHRFKWNIREGAK